MGVPQQYGSACGSFSNSIIESQTQSASLQSQVYWIFFPVASHPQFLHMIFLHCMSQFSFLYIINQFLSPSCYCFSNASFPAPQTGQTQSSGISSNAVPAAIPLSGSPFAGS